MARQRPFYLNDNKQFPLDCSGRFEYYSNRICPLADFAFALTLTHPSESPAPLEEPRNTERQETAA
jgi:hypothetical protein